MKKEDETGASRLLNRPSPEGYLEQWGEVLSQAKEAEQQDLSSVLIFRLKNEWFGISTKKCKEITESRTIHTVPNRTDNIFLGIVNIRGELQLCTSLHSLLGIEDKEDFEKTLNTRVYKRMALLDVKENIFVFPVDEVFGVHYYSDQEVTETPSNLDKSKYILGIVPYREIHIAILNADAIYQDLEIHFS